MTFFFCVLFGRGKKEVRKQRRNERGDTPPPFFELFYNETRSFFFFDSCIYLVILLLYICFDVNSTTLSWGCSRRAIYFALPRSS